MMDDGGEGKGEILAQADERGLVGGAEAGV